MLSHEEWTPELVATEAGRARDVLATELGVVRVWFFGSAARRQRLDYASDLDFAVQGLPAERYFGVLGRLLTVMQCPIDLVRWEDASDALRAQIAATGTVIHAA